MPKITIEYEVTHRYAVEVEVSEDTIQELGEECSLTPLEKYGISQWQLYDECVTDGWSEDDYAITDSDGKRIVPWTDED